MPSSPLALVAVGLSATLVPLASSMIAVALPSIGSEFHKDPSELIHWLVNSYLLVSIVGHGLGGKVADTWGYRRTLLLGQAIFGLGSLLAVTVPSFAALVFARILMAAGGALLLPTVTAIYLVTVPEDKRHRIFGYFWAMLGLSGALGPFVGGILITAWGWPSVFLVNLAPLFISVLASLYFCRREHGGGSKKLRFDAIGSLWLAGGLGSLVVGITGRPLLLIPAALLLFIFIVWEKTAPSPLIDLRLFGRRVFAAGSVLVTVQNLAQYALLFELPYLLESLYRWGPGRSGSFMTAFIFSMFFSSVLSGRVAEKVGAKTSCLIGSILSLTGVHFLSLLTGENDSTTLTGGLILAGLGLGFVSGPVHSAALSTIDRDKSGVASGILGIARYLGGIIGMTLLGFLLSNHSQYPTLERHHLALLATAGAFAVAACLSFLLPGKPVAVRT